MQQKRQARSVAMQPHPAQRCPLMRPRKIFVKPWAISWGRISTVAATSGVTEWESNGLSRSATFPWVESARFDQENWNEIGHATTRFKQFFPTRVESARTAQFAVRHRFQQCQVYTFTKISAVQHATNRFQQFFPWVESARFDQENWNEIGHATPRFSPSVFSGGKPI